MCLAVTGRLDRTPLLPWDKQRGFRCGDLRYLPGAPGLGPALGEQPSVHDLRRLRCCYQPGEDRRLGPGQRFAIANLEVCDRVLARENEVTIRWVPAHSRVAGNKQADSYTKIAARRTAPYNDDDVPEALMTEASLSHMSRSATEARSRALAEWIASHVRSERRYRPPPGRGLRR